RAAGLADRRGDETGGEGPLEEPLVLERVVELRRRHRPGVEPRVEHRVDALRATRALGARDRDVVHVRSVQVETGEVLACELAELGDRAHARVGLAVAASSDGGWRPAE